MNSLFLDCDTLNLILPRLTHRPLQIAPLEPQAFCLRIPGRPVQVDLREPKYDPEKGILTLRYEIHAHEAEQASPWKKGFDWLVVQFQQRLPGLLRLAELLGYRLPEWAAVSADQVSIDVKRLARRFPQVQALQIQAVRFVDQGAAIDFRISLEGFHVGSGPQRPEPAAVGESSSL